VDFLNGADGRLTEQPNLANDIRRRLTSAPYSRVFCPWFQEKHPDHVATYQFLREAVRGTSPTLQIWLYEVWTPLPANLYVPIDVTFATKLAAIQAHQSQLACLDYLSAFRGLAAYRSLSSPGSHYVEAFIDMDAQTLLNHVTR
jgi:LmbE family N-acetylglucosaminyl deacetylase